MCRTIFIQSYLVCFTILALLWHLIFHIYRKRALRMLSQAFAYGKRSCVAVKALNSSSRSSIGIGISIDSIAHTTLKLQPFRCTNFPTIATPTIRFSSTIQSQYRIFSKYTYHLFHRAIRKHFPEKSCLRIDTEIRLQSGRAQNCDTHKSKYDQSKLQSFEIMVIRCD